MASAGEVIYVDAGTYTGAVTVNKAVTLKGANYGVAGSATRVSESIISNPSGTALTISTSGSTVDGFNMLAGTAVSSTGVSATLRNNLLTLSRDFEFPNASGTLALTSDIGNFVDLTTAQTIGGNKTFTNPTTISNANYTTGFSNTFSFLDNNTT